MSTSTSNGSTKRLHLHWCSDELCQESTVAKALDDGRQESRKSERGNVGTQLGAAVDVELVVGKGSLELLPLEVLRSVVDSLLLVSNSHQLLVFWSEVPANSSAEPAGLPILTRLVDHLEEASTD
jgi:hypothetical protein